MYFLTLKFCCEALKCKPTKVDNDGNVYDQYGNKMGHYSTKPEYVDSDGNLYDKHHNKIQPDGIIF